MSSAGENGQERQRKLYAIDEQRKLYAIDEMLHQNKELMYACRTSVHQLFYVDQL